jgi:Fe-S oxidoreductase
VYSHTQAKEQVRDSHTQTKEQVRAGVGVSCCRGGGTYSHTYCTTVRRRHADERARRPHTREAGLCVTTRCSFRTNLSSGRGEERAVPGAVCNFWMLEQKVTGGSYTPQRSDSLSDDLTDQAS